MADEPRKIFPRNLTARAAYQVPGNPDVTRPEDSMGNCYPGLEVDVRNLDRRFFPGLVFEFVARDDVSSEYKDDVEYGARLAYVDKLRDPELTADTPEARALAKEIDDKGGALASGLWYLEWIQQAGKRITLRFWKGERKGKPLDGLYVWRIIRSLEPGPVKIGLAPRPLPDEKAPARGARARKEVTFEKGWRRSFTDAKTGVISSAYQPGEMTQSLCSPWQHDFRDCACHYWASNRPDVVHGEVFPGEATGPGGHPADPELATERLDWMRANRSRELGAGALDTIPKNRPYQMDHYQINDTWQSLSVVLDGAEIGGLYVPRQADQANPYGSPAELGAKLHDLAELEMALALEYLYARFSLQSPDAGKARSATLGADLIFARHQLMLAATSEMQHLRWVNEMLWGLQEAKLIPTFTPVLTVAREIPLRPGKAPRAAELRRLEPAVLQDFIDVEHPSGTLNGAYARVVATLRGRQYPARLRELAARIVSDGVEHESLFLNVQRLLVTYGPTEPFPYLRALAVDRSGRADGALATFQEIVEALDKAYRAAAAKRLERTGHEVAKARMAMARLLEQGEDLAAAGVGIPFF